MMLTPFWPFVFLLSRRLLIWSLGSILIGGTLLVTGAPFWRAFGVQAVAWGAIDGLIALAGHHQAKKNLAGSSFTSLDHRSKAKKLNRLLWINAGLDLLYIAGGLWLVLGRGATDMTMSGYGWGIIVQGGFLLLFDVFHARRVPSGSPLTALPTFSGPEHLPFLLTNGKPAALLVHGFPGTPAEMRDLGKALHQQGWTVRGLLLPGFGADLTNLSRRSSDDWVQAVREAIVELSKDHRPLLLLGYSMGGAVSIAALQDSPVDGMILLAPFLWEDPAWLRLFGPLLNFVIPPYFQPFSRANFEDVRIRKGISSLLPDLDLDDPEIQATLRQMVLPVSIFGALREIGVRAAQNLRCLQEPLLVIQGREDPMVAPQRTRRSVQKIPTTTRYVEVQAGHDLVHADQPAWSEIVTEVVRFANQLRS